MINRRTFAQLMAATAAFSGSRALSQTRKTVFYASVGPELTLYDVDAAQATLTRRSAIKLKANVQYAWPHPSRRYFYVASSNGQPGGGEAPKGDTHVLDAFTIDPSTGALAPHGQPRRLPSRPIHVSVDQAGEYVLTAFNEPSNVTVHKLNRDGTLGELVAQPQKPDAGIYAHQIRTIPSNSGAILVTRGNNATASKREDPGALKVFGFKGGVLTALQSVAPDNGYGFGPRHLDFHPTQPWLYVSIERQNQIQFYRMMPDGRISQAPVFVKSTLIDSAHVRPSQGAGTIHIHPNGRFVYVTNRNAGVVDYEGKKVANGGENNVALFSIDEKTGEPRFVEAVEGHGIQLRTFGIDPSGRMLVAASIMPLLVRNGTRVETLSAGLSVYRINEADGKLTFVHKYDVDVGNETQFWSGMVTLA